MSNILITGGLGYVGGRITSRLLETTDLTVYVTSRKTPVLPERLTGHSRLHIIHPDEIFSDQEMFDTNFDIVIHLAALNEIDCVKYPLMAIDFNIGKSVLLLQKAIRSKTKRFIYFSTAHIYGAPLTGHVTEQTIARPTHPYAITHRTVEDYVFAVHQAKQIEGISLRLSNSIGAPLLPDVNRWTLLVNDLCRQAVEKRSLTLLSAGTQQRDFVPLEDVARCAVFFTAAKKEFLNDGIFNMGGNCVMSVIEMARLIQSSCTDTLGYTPELIVPEQATAAAAETLDFDTKKLANSGFTWTGDAKKEIAQLLAFCKTNFSK